jgi:hypothetical protein
MLERFFTDLATRLYKENDLSDGTWTLVKNCKEFSLPLAD